MSLFKKAAEKAPANAKSKKERQSVVFDAGYFVAQGMTRRDADQAAADFASNIKELAEMKEQMATLVAKSKLIESDAQEKAREAFAYLYDRDKHQPENFDAFTADRSAQFMFIAADRYLKIDNDTADRLKETYGADIVAEETSYGFDADVLAQYEEEISAAIEKINIPQSAKDKLIVATTTVCVKKGTLAKLATFGKPVAEVLRDVQPVFSMKDVKKTA